jgi:Flp pilus assembly pilin Flp
MSTMKRLVRDNKGASLVEYIILVGIVALIAFGGFKYFGSQVTQKIHDQGGAVSNVNGALGN